MTIAPNILDKFKDILNDNDWTTDPDIIAPHLTEWRDKFIGSTPLLLMPRSTEDIQKIIKLANETSTKIAIQGGNTGLVGGSTPSLEGRDEVLLSLKKMNKILDVDTNDFSMTVEAGALLQDVQDAADKIGRYFPLSLASEGSCTIGGNISTNAGGIHVIRYGTMRDLTMGIEAVMPDGRLWQGLSSLRKDNTGFDINNLLIGAEGALGIVTKATLKLFPAPVDTLTAWVAIKSPLAALDLLAELREKTGDRLCAFELISDAGLSFVFDHIESTINPLMSRQDWYILFDISTGIKDPNLSTIVESVISEHMDKGSIIDGTIAQNNKQAAALWKLRESMSEAQKHEGASIKHDISVPVSKVPEFLDLGINAMEDMVKGCRVTPFGHMGDGNIHFNVMQPANMHKDDFLSKWPEMNRIVHDIVVDLSGSISAEHGIGTLKRDELMRTAAADKISLMKSLKSALDPNGILNIGRLL